MMVMLAGCGGGGGDDNGAVDACGVQIALVGDVHAVDGLGSTDGDVERYLFGRDDDELPEAIGDVVRYEPGDFVVSPPQVATADGRQHIGKLTAGDCSILATLLRGQAMRQTMLSTIDDGVDWVVRLSWPKKAPSVSV